MPGWPALQQILPSHTDTHGDAARCRPPPVVVVAPRRRTHNNLQAHSCGGVGLEEYVVATTGRTSRSPWTF